MAALRSSATEREEGALAVVGVKLYADGALGSRGAALLDDYSDDPGNRGLLQLQRAELERRVELCAAAGLQPAVHAIGDAANRMTLDVYADLLRGGGPLAGLRPRIEHAQLVAPADRPRFGALGVVPSMQPVHCTSDMPWAPARIGAGRVPGAYAWQALASGTSALAFGSDFPVEDPDPLVGVHAAVTRRTPEGEPPQGYPELDQRLTLREAFEAFTAGAARAARQEAWRGRLEPGCFADLTVLDRDPFASPGSGSPGSASPGSASPGDGAAAVLRARVTMTVVSGRVVWRAAP
jgi:predicted amidohydrolase YtcJ